MKKKDYIEREKERITSGNENILNEVVIPYLKTKLCKCGHGADKHMKKKIKEDFSCVVKNCNEKLLGRLSPDMDIQGIGFCKKHKTLVAGAYIALLNGNEKLFRSLTNN